MRLRVGTENRMRRQWSRISVDEFTPSDGVGTENRMRRQWSAPPQWTSHDLRHVGTENRMGRQWSLLLALRQVIEQRRRNGEQDAEAVEHLRHTSDFSCCSRRNGEQG